MDGGSGRILRYRAGPVRHALRRLSFYIIRNRVYYAIWAVLVLVYVAGFVYFPLLLGDTINRAIDGAPRSEVVRLCLLLAAVAIGRGILR